MKVNPKLKQAPCFVGSPDERMTSCWEDHLKRFLESDEFLAQSPTAVQNKAGVAGNSGRNKKKTATPISYRIFYSSLPLASLLCRISLFFTSVMGNNQLNNWGNGARAFGATIVSIIMHSSQNNNTNIHYSKIHAVFGLVAQQKIISNGKVLINRREKLALAQWIDYHFAWRKALITWLSIEGMQLGRVGNVINHWISVKLVLVLA
jgi:hypothetical protein